MSHHLVTAHDKDGRIVQLAVEVDEGDPAASRALQCSTKAQSQIWWRAYLASADWHIARVSSVKPIAGQFVRRDRHWYEAR